MYYLTFFNVFLISAKHKHRSNNQNSSDHLLCGRYCVIQHQSCQNSDNRHEVQEEIGQGNANLLYSVEITLFCLCVIAGSLLLHVLITRLLKIRYEYVLLGIVGAIADGTTSSLVASGARWKSLVSVGMLMGVIGGVCGNYVGIAVAYLIRMITGA